MPVLDHEMVQQNSPGPKAFGPRAGTKEAALKAPPTPRKRGAIPTGRNTPVLQNSITPLTRNRGRGRGRERSASRVATKDRAGRWRVD